MDPNFNQMIFRYGSFWFLLKIHPKWLFIEGFRGPRGVDGFGQFFFEPNGYLPVGNDTKHRQATPFARHMFEEPLNSTEDWRFFHVFFPTLGGMVRFPCWWLHDISWKLRLESRCITWVLHRMYKVGWIMSNPWIFQFNKLEELKFFPAASINSEMMPSGISSGCMLHWTFSVGRCFFLLAPGWHDFPTCDGKSKKRGAGPQGPPNCSCWNMEPATTTLRAISNVLKHRLQYPPGGLGCCLCLIFSLGLPGLGSTQGWKEGTERCGFCADALR